MSYTETYSNRIKSAKNYSIENILSTLGYKHKYTKCNGKELWYQSPFRPTEKTPSFVVNVEKNQFKDFGESGKGGDSIDLIMQLKSCLMSEALQDLETGGYVIHNSFEMVKDFIPDLPTYKIKKVQNLQNQALINYLATRKIDIDIAKLYLKEVYYFLNGKHYFALTMTNRSNGYEIRNKYFKGCIGKKDITILANGKPNVSVFEGFTDFLSLLTYKGISELKTDVLILNTTGMLDAAKDVLSSYIKAYSFLDNDATGLKTTANLSQILPTKKMNYMYKGYNDFNDFLRGQK